jgi:hypothetical protein
MEAPLAWFFSGGACRLVEAGEKEVRQIEVFTAEGVMVLSVQF